MISQVVAGIIMICLCAVPKRVWNCKGERTYDGESETVTQICEVSADLEELKYVFLTVWALSKGFLMIAYVSLFTYTSELLPSEIRGTFMGLASVIARLGPMVGIGIEKSV